MDGRKDYDKRLSYTEVFLLKYLVTYEVELILIKSIILILSCNNTILKVLIINEHNTRWTTKNPLRSEPNLVCKYIHTDILLVPIQQFFRTAVNVQLNVMHPWVYQVFGDICILPMTLNRYDWTTKAVKNSSLTLNHLGNWKFTFNII